MNPGRRTAAIDKTRHKNPQNLAVLLEWYFTALILPYTNFALLNFRKLADEGPILGALRVEY